MSQFRIDNQDIIQAGIFLDKELEQNLEMVLEERLPLQWAMDGTIIPMTADLQPGTRKLIEETQKDVGEARFLSDYTEDISYVDYSVQEADYKALDYAASFTYSILELNAARKAGRDIVGRKMRVANRVMVEKAHNFLLVGETKYNCTGLYNNPNVPVEDSGFDPNSITVQDHIDFMTEQLDIVATNNLLTAGVETVVIPKKLWSRWTSLLIPGTSDNLMSYFTKIYASGNGITENGIQFRVVNESDVPFLDANGVVRAQPGYYRLLFLPYATDAMSAKMYPMATLPAHLQGLRYHVHNYQGISELMIHYPNEILYSDITPVV